MNFYVQRQDNNDKVPLATVDIADTRERAAVKATEYRKGDPTAIYYVSIIPCSNPLL